MISPAAMFIEAAVDSLKELKTSGNWIIAAQRKELHEAMGDQSPDFQAGYELGLQTARVLLAGNLVAVENHVQI